MGEVGSRTTGVTGGARERETVTFERHLSS